MEEHLVYGPGDLQGDDFYVDRFLAEFLVDLYRVDPQTMRRVVRRGVLGVAKGNAKSEIEAAIDLFELIGNPVLDRDGVAVQRRSPDIPVAAASYEQADLVFGAARIMCEKIGDLLNVYDTEIERKDGTGRMYRVAAVAGTNDGGRATSVSIDELHEWVGNKERVYLILTGGLIKRRDAYELTISTAGDPRTSTLLLNLYDYGRQVASGEIVDPTFVMHWYEADEGLDVTEADDLAEAIAQANPGTWVDHEGIARRLTVDKIDEHEFRRYHLNQWVASSKSWLPLGSWATCGRNRRVPPKGAQVCLGFDGSYTGDSTALYGCTMTPKPFIWRVGLWENTTDDPDWRVPRSDVDQVVIDAFDKWDVVELAADPHRWEMFMDEWVFRWGDDRVIDFPQSHALMVPATAKFYDAVVHELLSHDSDQALARHVSNATTKVVAGKGYVLVKDHPDRKIDAAIAAVIAHARATHRRDAEDVWASVELV
jgi:phage terminase large subunit-like protein